MKCRFFLNIIVRQSAPIFQLLSSKDETLLIWWYTFLVLNLCFHIFDSVGGFNFKSNCLSSQSFDKNLHSSPETKYEVKSRFLLNVVVRKSSAIFKLFSGEDQTLLIWRNSLLILDLGLNIFYSIRGFNLKGDSLAS